MQNTEEQARELPLTKLHRTHEAKNAVISLFPTIMAMMSMAFFLALFSIFSQERILWWIGLVGFVVFGILSFASIRDLNKKVKMLSEVAIQNAWDFATEFHEHEMTKFHITLERARNLDSTPGRNQPTLPLVRAHRDPNRR